MKTSLWKTILWCSFALWVSEAYSQTEAPLWKEQKGVFVTFLSPISLLKKNLKTPPPVDILQEEYDSTDLALTFEREFTTVPDNFQKQFDSIVESWVQSRTGSWKKFIFLNNGKITGSMKGFEKSEPNALFPFQLYLELGENDKNKFGMLIRFNNLDTLPIIERILKSLKFKV